MKYGVCTNQPSLCRRAAARELMPMTGPDTRCPEPGCGKPLLPAPGGTPRRRFPAVLAAAGLVAIVAAGAGVYVLRGSKAGDPPVEPAAPSRTRYFAGVDLGSRSVKAFIYSFVRGDEGIDTRIVYQRDQKTNLVTGAKAGRFSPQGIDDATATVKVLVDEMRGFAKLQAIEPRYFILASSGVAKFANRAELKAAVDQATGVALEFLDGRTEARDALLAAVPTTRRDESLLVDVGGANTKLGCMTAGAFSDAELPYGAVTLRQLVPPDRDYLSGLQEVLGKVVGALAAERMNTPCIATRARTYLTGGPAFAVATFMHPEAALWGYVPLSRKDVADFKRALRDGTWNTEQPRIAFEPAVPPAQKEATLKAHQADRTKAQDNYSREDYLAGVSILAAILENGNPTARLYFVRNANHVFGYAVEKYGPLTEAAVAR